jgi:hypothetical protein
MVLDERRTEILKAIAAGTLHFRLTMARTPLVQDSSL